MFRGREQSRPELGYRLLQRLGADVADYGFVETSAKQDGRNMTMVLAPHRGAKTRAKAAHDADASGLRRRAQPATSAPTDTPTHRTEDTCPRRRPTAALRSGSGRTGTGKIVRQKANRRHLLEHKASEAHPPARRPHRGGSQRHQARQEAAERLSSAATHPYDLNEIGTLPWHA